MLGPRWNDNSFLNFIKLYVRYRLLIGSDFINTITNQLINLLLNLRGLENRCLTSLSENLQIWLLVNWNLILKKDLKAKILPIKCLSLSNYLKTKVKDHMKTFTQNMTFVENMSLMMNLIKINLGKKKSNLPMTRGPTIILDYLIWKN